MEATQIGADAKRPLANIPNTSKCQEYNEKDRWAVATWTKADVRKRHESQVQNKNEDWGKKLKAIMDKSLMGYLFALVGNRGVGKTQLAVEAMRYTVFKKYRTARYTTAMDVFITIKGEYASGGSEETALEKFKLPQVLVIDEIQERGQTGWEDRVLTYLVDWRYSQMKDTLLVSNQTEEKFLESIGASIASRMKETGGIIKCEWSSFR